jgi:hypothetical protein
LLKFLNVWCKVKKIVDNDQLNNSTEYRAVSCCPIFGSAIKEKMFVKRKYLVLIKNINDIIK